MRKKPLLFIITLIPFTLLFALSMLTAQASSESAEAVRCRSGTAVVTNGNDSGAGSLRDAVASLACIGGTVTFAPAMDGQTVTLDSEIEISERITVSAETLDVTISGNNVTSMFAVRSSADLTLAHLTLANGVASAGGAIFNSGKLSIESSQLINNRAEQLLRNAAPRGGLFSAGGAIYNDLNAELVVRDSQFTNNVAFAEGGAILNLASAEIHNTDILSNSAATGGGIYSTGTLTVQVSQLAHNQAGNNGAMDRGVGSFGSGGAVYVEGSAEIHNTDILSNSAATGGGIYSTGNLTVLTVHSSQLAHNQAGNNGTVTRGGGSFGSGGAVYTGGSAEIRNTDIFSNSAGNGGGIFNADVINPAATLQLFESTLRNNTSIFDGGGLYNQDTAFIRNSTLSGNHAQGLGGAIFGTAFTLDVGVGTTVINSTLSDNRADGNIDDRSTPASTDAAIHITFSNLGLGNTIIANSVGGADCILGFFVGFSDFGNNLIESSTAACGLTGGSNGNIIGQDPALAPLADNPSTGSGGASGATLTHALLPNSPAIGAADIDDCPALDQRGVQRSVGLCDMGAFESDGANCVATHGGSEEQVFSADSSAVQAAINAASADGTVKVAGICIGVQPQIFAGGTVSQTAYIDKGLTLEGGHTPSNWDVSPDSTLYPTILNANNQGRVVVLHGESNADFAVTLNHLTIQNGDGNDAGGGFNPFRTRGGGIFVDGDVTLQLANSRVISSSAVDGGGLFSFGTASVISSTIANNQATTNGGGIASINSANLFIRNSTISGNSARRSGGIRQITAEGTMRIENSTVSGNSAEIHGSALRTDATTTIINSTIYSNTTTDDQTSSVEIRGSATLTLTNTIIGNSTNSDCDVREGATVTVSHSLMQDGSCGTTDGVNGNLIADAQLGPLADNGPSTSSGGTGATMIHAVLPDSPAIAAGNQAGCDADPIFGKDQRGFARDAACDIGAYEEAGAVPTAVSMRQFSTKSAPSISVLLLALCLTAITAKSRRPKIPQGCGGSAHT